MSWAAPFVGRTDLDCWQLVRAIYDQCGVQLPTYGEIDHRELRAVEQTLGGDCVRPPWSAVQPFPGAEREYDVVVMKGWLRCADGQKRRGVVHTGIVTRCGHVLHTDTKYQVVEVPLSHVTLRGRLVGCYRHQLLRGA